MELKLGVKQTPFKFNKLAWAVYTGIMGNRNAFLHKDRA